MGSGRDRHQRNHHDDGCNVCGKQQCDHIQPHHHQRHRNSRPDTDGYTRTAEKGIELSAGQTLTINGGAANSGRLVINGCSVGDAGIGAVAVGTLVINGGNITVTGGLEAAGIGGSFNM